MTEKENKPEELKLHEQGDGSIIVGDAPKEEYENHEEPLDEDQHDERLSSDENKDEEGNEEETADEADARRERNRKRRSENKERRKEYIESLKRELSARDSIINDLASRVSNVERTTTGSQLVHLDNAISEAEAQYKELQDINKQAIEQANGEVAVAAQERMFAIRNRHAQLSEIKKNLVRQPSQPNPLDPRAKKNGDSWHKKNNWFNPDGSDMDSRIALTVDSQLVQEGWNPATEEYWNELDARLSKYLPNKVNKEYTSQQSTRQRSPVSGGRETSSNGTPAQYKLSSKRVQALKDAGVWDDPKKRADAIKYYQQYDKQNSSN